MKIEWSFLLIRSYPRPSILNAYLFANVNIYINQQIV